MKNGATFMEKVNYELGLNYFGVYQLKRYKNNLFFLFDM